MAEKIMRKARLRGMHLAFWISGTQVLLGLLSAICSGWLAGWPAAQAAFYGSIVAALPAFYMALHLLPKRLPNDARSRRVLLGLGQGGKWLLTGMMFIVGVLVYAQQFGYLLTTYVVCQFSYWLALRIIR